MSHPSHWRKTVLMSKEPNNRDATAGEMGPQPVSIVYSREQPTLQQQCTRECMVWV